MNKAEQRFDEIEKQSYTEVMHERGGTYMAFDKQKFAELIVKECLSIVDDAERGGSNEVWDNAVKFIRRDLKEHFGVAEREK